MGRQKGEGARSKSRPSSSSLAASLLPSGQPLSDLEAMSVVLGSIHLSHPKSFRYASIFWLAVLLFIHTLEDIDSEMAQHLKRLARKDPTTKGNRLCDRGLEECSSELHVERTCAI
ncbi:hypothetical protein CK203_078561 [Vitis vinifera]|uniref:E3 ubiquitin-protein ligase listerin n=1 Tax=Vitis vinifera TaxID=29760 RepID=A0A438FA96_VITVI|nr:hypothetical protein CK203_078561 [Vitis vinifera]